MEDKEKSILYLESRCRSQDKLIKDFEVEFKKLKNGNKQTKQNFKKLQENYKINPVGMKRDYGKIASTRMLTKIIVFLSEVNYSSKSKIAESTGINSKKLNDALNFLVNHKIVDIIKGLTNISSLKCYRINPLFRK